MSAEHEWAVDFYEDARGKRPLVDWLEELTDKERAKIARTIGLLQKYGAQLPMPHARHLRGKLYELRVASGPRDYRILYFAVIGRRFVLLHGFSKKTQKTPEKELVIAERRMVEWQSRNAKREQE